jgi:hypothetical protein
MGRTAALGHPKNEKRLCRPKPHRRETIAIPKRDSDRGGKTE